MNYKEQIYKDGVYHIEMDLLARNSIHGDEYYTYEHHAQYIADNLDLNQGDIVWCPFDKDESMIVKALRDHGFTVVNTHLDYGQDFFTTDPPEDCKAIVSNPPFSIKKQVMNRVKDLGIPFAMILPELWLSGGVPFDYGNQMLWFRKRMQFFTPRGEYKKARTNSFILSNGLLKKNLIIIMD